MLSDPGMLELALLIAATLVGATGTWSPCGLSMIETIGPAGHSGRLAVTLAACATFLPGALTGGLLTFGALAALGGALHGAGDPLAYGIAAAAAAAAALAEARGLPIVPQIRRQLPEGWRRAMPMPLAAGLYGVLLGLGFTTFVLSFGVWALAGIALALGEPGLGLLIGAGFGIGRAIPIVAIAPFADRRAGGWAMDLLTLSPSIYRGARLGDALALALVVVALGGTELADAGGGSRTEVRPGADPSIAEPDLVYQRPDRIGVLRRSGTETVLDGTSPALGGRYLALYRAGAVRLIDRETLTELGSFEATGVDALALSNRWLLFRRRAEGKDKLHARRIRAGGAAFGPAKRLAVQRRPNQIGSPAVQGSLAFYPLARRKKSLLLRKRLPGGSRKTLLRSNDWLVSSPSVRRGRLLWVQSLRGRQRLRVRGFKGRHPGRSVYGRKPSRGILWTTALSRRRAYATVLRRSGAVEIISTRR